MWTKIYEKGSWSVFIEYFTKSMFIKSSLTCNTFSSIIEKKIDLALISILSRYMPYIEMDLGLGAPRPSSDPGVKSLAQVQPDPELVIISPVQVNLFRSQSTTRYVHMSSFTYLIFFSRMEPYFVKNYF